MVKVFIFIRYRPQIIFCYFFHKMDSVVFLTEVNRYYVSCTMQLLLEIYTNSFETIQVFRPWSENVHIHLI